VISVLISTVAGVLKSAKLGSLDGSASGWCMVIRVGEW
jgi:hypothetical protein